ncbi:MAG: saccharopine dehydrogenase NADP-binding domain-containing protein [Clostridiales Family XIII bacterium]|jgi:shikimate 5-dehydrogenase/shikimate kinase|nr:saccharopine dehydrogenase NADP-binding domain-containing protein [Clostridiales Family XIII bacterium]
MPAQKKLNNIILIGMPGSGKTSLGWHTAESLGLEFLDTDVLITEQAGRSIPDIFAQDGEPVFRDLETEVLTAIHSVKPGGLVLAVGGGLPLREENVRLMRETGLVIFIDRPLELLEQNISYRGDRPLLSDTMKLRRLYEQRRPVYLSAADITYDNSDSYLNALNNLEMIAGLSGAAASYCVIGDPVAHSKSPLLHNAAFKKTGIDEKYIAVRVPEEQISLAISVIKAGTIKGLNVTKPHKESIISALDELRGDAKESGAVNTVVREALPMAAAAGKARDSEVATGTDRAAGIARDSEVATGTDIAAGIATDSEIAAGTDIAAGKEAQPAGLIGYNTDMEGLRLALERKGRTYQGSRVAILGTGGAAMGVCHKAAMSGAERVLLIGRNKEKAMRIAAATGGSAEAAAVSDYTEVGKLIGDADILINATPLGMDGIMDEFVSFGFLDFLKKGAMVYDLIYNPAETKLLAEAKKRGLDTDNGLSMLIFQGIISEELFFGREIDRDALFDALYPILA